MVLRSMNPVSRDRHQCSIIRAKWQATVNTTLSIDLSQNWVNATVTIYSTTKPDGVPKVNRGSLWYDESTDLLYTGYTGGTSTFDTAAKLPPPSIWTFQPNNLGGGTWNQTIPSSASVWNTIKTSYGGYQAYGNGSAYILGGFSSQSTLESYLATAHPGMIKFNMSSQIFSNISSSNISETFASTVSGGGMQYVPFFGSNGIFVVMGGDNYFGAVQLFDPASGAWYKQTTTGSTPSPRTSFCTAGAASTDNTYEILVYAGLVGGGTTGSLSTVYILSLPAFNWFIGADTTQHSRAGHTCEAVGGSQIVVVGGLDPDVNPDPNGTVENSASELAEQGFSTPDPFAQGLAIFDLRTLDFAAQYVAGGAAVYEPNEVITQFYTQGSYSGNLAADVAQLMKETHFTPGTSSSSTANFPPATSSNSTATNSTLKSPSTSSPSNSSHTNYTIPITNRIMGGLLGIALIIALVFWLLRRRRRRMQDQQSQPWAPEIDGNARAELQQRGSRLELGSGEAHEKDGNARGELGYGEAHEKDGNARAELPG